ncbi:MAG: sigma-54 dependent transcriptional regulator [Thermodesulfobacteriota bacterium]
MLNLVQHLSFTGNGIMLNILIAFKNPPSREIIKALKSHKVETLPPEGLASVVVKAGRYDLLLLEQGKEAFSAIKANDPRLEIIVFGTDAADAIEAIKAGAFACVDSLSDITGFSRAVERVEELVNVRAETQKLEKSISGKYTFHGAIGRNPRMLELFSFIRRLAPYYRVAAITGETGVGKEVLAKALHEESPVASKPFMVFNCGGVVENLVESELFGHKKGAFTGAVEDKAGLFEATNDGTLFLDEVENLPLLVQPHLLRVLQDGGFRRLGSNKELKARCRVIAASNRDLETEVKEGRLRQDLYFRLTPLTLSVPPLRDRKDDLPLLSRFFLERFNKRTGKDISGISRPAQTILASYDWPGNVRELENVIERAAILTGETFIKLDDLPDSLRSCAINPSSAITPAGLTLDGAINAHILSVLARTGGNRTKAAEILGISRRALLRKIEKYSIK